MVVGGVVEVEVDVEVVVDVDVDVDVDEAGAVVVCILDVLVEHPATVMASNTPPASRITTVAAS